MAVHDQHPHGVERLYVDGRFNTDPGFCETYGYDIATGAPRTPTEYRGSNRTAGRFSTEWS